MEVLSKVVNSVFGDAEFGFNSCLMWLKWKYSIIMGLILKITRHYRDVRCGTSGISISQENTKSRSSGTKGIYKWPWQNLLQIHTKKINLIRLEKIKLVLVWTKLRNILEMFMFWWRILEFRDCIKIYIKNVGLNIWIPPAHTDKGSECWKTYRSHY